MEQVTQFDSCNLASLLNWSRHSPQLHKGLSLAVHYLLVVSRYGTDLISHSEVIKHQAVHRKGFEKKVNVEASTHFANSSFKHGSRRISFILTEKEVKFGCETKIRINFQTIYFNYNNNVPFLYSAYHIQMVSLCARGINTPALALMQPFSAKSIWRNKFLLGTHLLHLGRERQLLWTKCLV